MVERAFGVLKRRFTILRGAPQYPLDTQVQILYACVVIHNYLARHRASELDIAPTDDEDVDGGPEKRYTRAQDVKMDKQRHDIADRMWSAYTSARGS